MPRRKPASQRLNRETRDIGLVRQQTHGVPEAPKVNGRVMLAETKRAWVAFWSSDVASLVVDADRTALDRLFALYDARERMARTFAAEPFTAGSVGQVRIHPAGTEIASLDGRIVALEDRFGITPAGRLKLGIVLGAAAKSLEEMNATFSDDDETDEGGEQDPRLRVIDATATG